jgi:nitrate/TMAO reductase-like tetraheme cytochrome c subunit
MRLIIVLAVTISYAALMLAGSPRGASLDESKEMPKQVVLDKDSQSDKYGEVPFNHENHTKKYSPDGKSEIACVECHHTDQPASSLKPPLKTSERNVTLTAALLATPEAAPVKTCRTCHLQRDRLSQQLQHLSRRSHQASPGAEGKDRWLERLRPMP